MADTLDTAGIWIIKEYIQRRKVTIVSKVTFRLIYEMCTGAERIPGACRFMRWWDHNLGWEVK